MKVVDIRTALQCKAAAERINIQCIVYMPSIIAHFAAWMHPLDHECFVFTDEAKVSD